MKCLEALERLTNFKNLKKIYLGIEGSSNLCYTSEMLQDLIVKCDKEIQNLIDLLYSMELEDSYDQNTGEINNILTFGGGNE